MDRPVDNVEGRPQGAEGIAEVARIISRAGLVEAFGHVSARSGDGILITPTRPLGGTTESDVLEIDAEGRPVGEAEDVPLEAALHAAVYAAREDVGAIVRTHSPAAVAAGASGEVPPLVHGLGGLAGEVAICDRIDLVSDAGAGEQVAGALGPASNLLLRGNGSFSVGTDLAEAAVKALYLEERCLVGGQTKPDRQFDEAQLAARSRWFAAESERAWAWMRWRYGGDN